MQALFIYYFLRPSHLQCDFSLDFHAMKHHRQTHTQCCLYVAGEWLKWLC